MKPFTYHKFPIGANMAFRKYIIDKYGDFNTALGRKGDLLEGSEEKNLFNRLKSNKEKIYYLPEAIVFHIVSASRLSQRFIRMQAIGIGFSEWKRSYFEGNNAVVIKTSGEIFKWLASFILFFWYLITLEGIKGWMIVKFRFYVTLGYLKGVQSQFRKHKS
ncbi:MAG: hypothetical protein NT175_00710 [Bacteroidetes bacterium]|nr:hypothetical protein [Bacteroidota bacterium]